MHLISSHKNFITNVSNVWGEEGKKWVASLPQLAKELAKAWSLTHIQPVDNLSYNFVAKAIQFDEKPVVLKISFDADLIKHEHAALQHFEDCGAVKIYQYDLEKKAMLLQEAKPGIALKDHPTLHLQSIMQIYAKVVRRLSSEKLTKNHFKHMREWCKAIDRPMDERVPNNFIAKAKLIRNNILKTIPFEYVCHGDLHLDNVIENNEEWLIIDAKGIIGEIAFEAAAFDLVSDSELHSNSVSSAIISDRIHLLAKYLNIDARRLLAWVFLRIMISIRWYIEDNGDPSKMLKLAELVYPLL